MPFSRFTASRAERAAADLHALICETPGLDGVEAEVRAEGGRAILVTVTRLPMGAVEQTPGGLAATVEGARITDLLLHLAHRAATRARLTRPTVFRIRPAALQAAVHPQPLRRAS